MGRKIGSDLGHVVKKKSPLIIVSEAFYNDSK